MNGQDQTVGQRQKWGWRGFALEIAVFCLLQGIGIVFHLLNGHAYAVIGDYVRVSAWFAAGAVRLVRHFPVATVEIRRLHTALRTAQARRRWEAEQPIVPPTRREWTMILSGVTLMFGIGLLVAYGQPPIRIQCERGLASRVDCRVQQTMFWFIPVGEQNIPDVQSVRADEDIRTESSQGFDEAGKTHIERDISLEFNSSDHRQMVITLDGALSGSFKHTAVQIRALIASDKPQIITAWHAPSLPTLISLSFVFVPSLVYFSALMQFIKKPRASIQRRRQPQLRLSKL